MARRPSYYVEKYAGRLLGLAVGLILLWLFHKHPARVEFLNGDDVYDKLITISTTLFGFLLAVLTLIVQGNSSTLTKMREYGSFVRLIRYNRNVVVSSAVVCILSFILGYCRGALDSLSTSSFKIGVAINLGIFTWTLLDVFLFVLIFYRILLRDIDQAN